MFTDIHQSNICVHPKQPTLLYQLIDINSLIIIIATISTTTLTSSLTGGGWDACRFCSTTSSTGLLVSGNNPKCQERAKSVCDKSLSFGQKDRNEVRLLLKETNSLAVSNKFYVISSIPLQSRGYCVHSLDCLPGGGANPWFWSWGGGGTSAPCLSLSYPYACGPMWWWVWHSRWLHSPSLKRCWWNMNAILYQGLSCAPAIQLECGNVSGLCYVPFVR